MNNSKKGQVGVWILIVTVAVLLVGGAAFYITSHNGGNTFNIGGSCTDYTPIAGSPTCATDADCLAALVPADKTIDPGVTLRCNTGTCEMRLATCSGRVSV